MPTHPLLEVFGFPPEDFSTEAKRYRRNRLCPYNNTVPNCTKDKKKNPLGVCSIYEGDTDVTIVCPVRFRQSWVITDEAAAFFFPEDCLWTSLTEVRLNDKHGNSAGNIDIVLVAYDSDGQLLDFGSVEVQSVYISGNIRRPFEHYMENPTERHEMDWTAEAGYPRPDYLSSSRKRLAPQLIYKGGILNSWQKKMAVVMHSSFYRTLPQLPEAPSEEADIAWIVYDLEKTGENGHYDLVHSRTIYTLFRPALEKLTTTEAGPVKEFTSKLQGKLDEKLEEDHLPDGPTLLDLLQT